MNEKVIALIDMDCFYVQVANMTIPQKNTQFNSQSTTSATKVEAREKPALKGVPAAVVQVVFKRNYIMT